MRVWEGEVGRCRGFHGRWLRKDHPRIGPKVAQLRTLMVQVKWCVCVCVCGGGGVEWCVSVCVRAGFLICTYMYVCE